MSNDKLTTQNNGRTLSMTKRIATAGEFPRLIEMKTEDALDVIFIGVVKMYAFLGHTKIFKGTDADKKLAKVQLMELSSQILEGLKNNPSYRYITKLYFEAIIEKGCSGIFEEIPTVSPFRFFQWIDQFNNKYLPQIKAMKNGINKQLTESKRDTNEEERIINEKQIRLLFDYMENETVSDYADLKKFHGEWIGKVLFQKYADFFPLVTVQKFRKRRDIWDKSKNDAVLNISYFKGKTLAQVTEAFYSYNIFEMFAKEYKGDEMNLEFFISVINDYHNKNTGENGGE